jgi:DNA-binding XRE family transcriptional regulator
MSITNQPGAFAWTVNYARGMARKSQLEIAGAARLNLKEYIALEQGRYIPRLWQVLLLADALDIDREWLCRLASTDQSQAPKKQAAAAGVSLRVPGQHRCA